VVAITAAMPNGTALDRFRIHHPEKYFDVGIAEEHAVLFAAGLATRGLKPFCAIYSTFLQRAFDPVVHDVCLQKLPVVFCMDRGGLSGDDGPTHHGVFDISYLRGIPNMVHMDPKDEDELADMLYTAMLYDGPIAVRYPRGSGPGAAVKDVPRAIPIGKAELLQHGENDRVAIFALGSMVPMAFEVAMTLEEEAIEAAVINARFAKPIDREMVKFQAGHVDAILTLEDHVLNGGFGSAVLEAVSDAGLTTPVIRIGWPDRFIEHGKPDDLRKKYGISVQVAREKLRPHLQSVLQKTAVSGTSKLTLRRNGGKHDFA
jgi:1-deoxy-D-xylulose-5-phosphate synthase